MNKRLSFRVWYVDSEKGSPSYTHVLDVEEAKEEIRRLTVFGLQRDIVWNAMGLEVYNEEERKWEEWYDDMGDDIMKVMEEDEVLSDEKAAAEESKNAEKILGLEKKDG